MIAARVTPESRSWGVVLDAYQRIDDALARHREELARVVADLTFDRNFRYLRPFAVRVERAPRIPAQRKPTDQPTGARR